MLNDGKNSMKIELLRQKSMSNWENKRISEKAGCFFCGRIYPVNEVKEYVSEHDDSKTAQCPYCNIDAVIFDSDCELSEDILIEMQEEYFLNPVDD